MASVTQLGYLGINTTDLAAWRAFMVDVLGMRVSAEAADGSLSMRMDERHHRFTFHPSDEDDLAYVGWQVADEHALEAIAAQVEAAGIRVSPGTPELAQMRRVLGLITFTDPGGIPTEVFYGPEISRKPFYPSRYISGFKTGVLGLGHVVVWYPDIPTGLRFYRDVLGFRVSDSRESTAFLHCNPRHHSIALFQARPNIQKRINHFMVEYNSLDDVGTAFDICLQRGDRFATTLGRHPNDQMVSFYVYNPGGFNSEAGWSGRLVDDSTWQTELYSDDGGSVWGHHRESEGLTLWGRHGAFERDLVAGTGQR